MKVIDNQRWVLSNFGQCELGDKRRTKRLMKLASNMLVTPQSSIPQQNVQWADVKAAYRFFDSEHSAFDRVAQSHWSLTRQTKPGRYLMICDTTDIDQISHKATTGLGILGDGRGRGVQLHSCLVFNWDEKQIVGSAGAILYYRKHTRKEETRAERLARVRESSVWGDLADQVGKPPQDCHWIHVWDRGGDNFEAICHVLLSGNDWIIRAAQMARKVHVEDQILPFHKAIENATKLGSYELNMPSREGVAARIAKIEVSVAKVTYPLPSMQSKWVKQCGIQELAMNVVLVDEVNAPQGKKPIRWILLTSLPVNTFEQAWEVIEAYEYRWLIEEYHKAMKSGCSLEAHALRTADRLEPLIGLISVVGVRLIQLKLVGRNQPTAKAATHVPSSWLKCLKLVRPKCSIAEMSVYEFFRQLAMLGGFLGRKGDGEPGWQTIWRGFEKMQLLIEGMQLANRITPQSFG